MFEPRLREGAWLRESSFATAMIDVSDGLARDAGHIAVQSGVTVRLAAASIPVSRAAIGLNDGISPLDHALYDGEDFELLFAVPAGKGGRLAREWRRRFRLPLTRIGFVERGAPAVLIGGEKGGWLKPAAASFEHFAR
jgi:thiamine-monophosphate kinase